MQHERGVTTLHPWFKGMNNIAGERGLPDDTVRNAVNVDFRGREIVSRPGATLVYSAVSPQGGFTCPAGSYFIQSGGIKKFSPPSTATTLFTGLAGATFAWFYLDGVVYFSDGVVSKKIINDVVYPWGLPAPAAPVLSSTAGTLDAGQYLAAVCAVDSFGVEHGASDIVKIDLPANSGVKFSDLPNVDASYLRLYLSMPNGKHLFHIADLTPGTDSYTISAGRYDDSITLAHAFVSPAPAGRIIRSYQGCMLVADALGNVWHSDPLEMDHFRLGDNWLQFPEPVDVMEPVKDGIWFAYGNRTEFYAGSLVEGLEPFLKVEYGGVFGTGQRIPRSEQVCWQSHRGMVIGGPGGAFSNEVEKNVAVDTAAAGVSMVREQNGMRSFVACLQQPTMPTLAASSWIDAEVIRREG